MRNQLIAVLTVPLLAVSALAQGGGGGGGGGLSDSARAAREAAANRPRTIAGINSVWIEDLTQPELRAMEERSRAGSWMGYKYIPRIAGGGADLEYATVFPTEQVYDRAEIGSGRVRFFPSTFERNPTHWQVVNLLCQLEPLEYRSAVLTHGKTRLFAGRARALR